jgi:hypothetical protein
MWAGRFAEGSSENVRGLGGVLYWIDTCCPSNRCYLSSVASPWRLALDLPARVFSKSESAAAVLIRSEVW